MGKKKNKVTPVENRAAQAKANAEKLANMFLTLGLEVETWKEYQPSLDTEETFSVVSLPKLLDGEGWPYEFRFSHSSGQIVANDR
ncbi:MAG: hypothetical protein J6N95_01100 [Bacilli bacterium]|nr:hypothetical protein [Bacilli bacterium]